MHGYARFRLVGTATTDSTTEPTHEEAPLPLPFPTCVRDLPRRGGGAEALAALDAVTISFEKVLRALGPRADADDHGNDGPRAA